ncbi:MAG: hypothetical protein Q7S38_00890 [bacterium]|nr:hypothetical protein [bacterium]
MTATGHAVIGTVIAAKIGNPALAIPIALLSHIAADLFPHWDSGTNGKKKSRRRMFIESAIDVCIGFAVSYAILFLFFPNTSLIYAFFMIIVAQSFDWISAPYYILKIKFLPLKWFYEFQSSINSKLDKPWGIINQVAVLILIVALGKLL